MIHQPPAGARDLLPLEVAQKSWINDSLQEVFQRWGYQRIVTSTIEWLDTLMAGGAIEPSKVIQLMDFESGRLGLRPELTASIARAAVTRMEASSTQRLCYRANIFRNPPSGYHGRQLEFYQAGVELLFAQGILADGEIILLLADCLKKLRIQQWHLILGEASLTRSLLSAFPEALKNEVRLAIANLDRVSLENLSLSPELKQRALLLFDLRGKPQEVLEKVASLELDESATEIVNNLKSLVELLNQTTSHGLPLILDLSVIQSIDYYTGLVFEVVSINDGKPHILGQGGRYDELLGVYHPQKKSSPGIGFALNIEDLHASLLSTSQLPQTTPASDWLVIPQTEHAIANAFIYAQKLRQSQHLVRVEIDLERRSATEIREYAKNNRINNLAWIQADGSPTLETI